MTTKLTLLALLLSLTGILGCMNKIPAVAHYQKKATETCEGLQERICWESYATGFKGCGSWLSGKPFELDTIWSNSADPTLRYWLELRQAHSADVCKPLNYPACNESGCHQ